MKTIMDKEVMALIGAFKAPLLDLLKDAKDEAKYFLDNGLPAYLNSHRLKFLFTKTFLFRTEKVNFLDIYFPTTIQSKNNINYKVLLEKNFEEIFYNSRYATIIGSAGSGKSMLLKYIFLKSIELKFKIPIYFELRNFNDFDGSIMDYIYKVIFNNKLAPNKRILERLLTKGEFLFLIDGYDEIQNTKLSMCTSEIETFIDVYDQNYFVISSRPGVNIETFPRFDNFSIQPLSKDEIETFIKLELKEAEDDQLASKIIEAIRNSKVYESYISNPLLLSMFILVFATHPVLPTLKSKFYWNVFDTLCTRHDSITKRGGYQHERKTGLQNDEIQKIIEWFSYISYFEDKYSFDLEYLSKKLLIIKEKFDYAFDVNDIIQDLTVSVPIILQDGIEYNFIHRSLQEYFTALLISQQSENIKQKIYNDKVQKIYMGWGFSELCSEIDKISFNKYYLIVAFKGYLLAFDGINEKERIYNYIKKQKINLDLSISEGELRINGMGSSYGSEDEIDFYSIAITNMYIQTKLHMFYFDCMFYKLKNKKPEIFDKLLKKNIIVSNDDNRGRTRYNLKISEYWSDEVYEFLEYINFDVSILKILKKIKDEIIEMERFIEDEEKNKELLLCI